MHGSALLTIQENLPPDFVQRIEGAQTASRFVCPSDPGEPKVPALAFSRDDDDNLRRFHERYCKPRGHLHVYGETIVCVEYVLAKRRIKDIDDYDNRTGGSHQ